MLESDISLCLRYWVLCAIVDVLVFDGVHMVLIHMLRHTFVGMHTTI